MKCDQEMCDNWTGFGCICEALQLRDDTDDAPEPSPGTPKEIPLNGGGVALVDAADYPWLMALGPWHVIHAPTTSYARRYASGGPNVPMHRDILCPLPEEKVDHIDGDGLNNQRANLRICTNTQNAHNTRLRANNSTGWKGVSYHARTRKYGAEIMVDGKTRWLGTFTDPMEAARAYAVAALEIQGEFANIPRLNELFPEKEKEMPRDTDVRYLRSRIKEIADELEHSKGLFDSMKSWPEGANGPVAIAAYESLVLRAEKAVFMLRATLMRTDRD